MNKRRSLTPSTGMPNVLPRAQARRGGARQTAGDRVTFRSEGGVLREGWALNVSRGGLRAILDDDAADSAKVELGEEYAISVGGAEPDEVGDASEKSEKNEKGARKGRIVWLQEEPDGFVVGVEYLSPSGHHLAAPLSVPVPEPPASTSAVDASGVNPAASLVSEARVRADSSAGDAEEAEEARKSGD